MPHGENKVLQSYALYVFLGLFTNELSIDAAIQHIMK